MTYAFSTKHKDDGWTCQIARLHNKHGSQIWFSSPMPFKQEYEAIEYAADWLISFLKQAPKNIDYTEFC